MASLFSCLPWTEHPMVTTRSDKSPLKVRVGLVPGGERGGGGAAAGRRRRRRRRRGLRIGRRIGVVGPSAADKLLPLVGRTVLKLAIMMALLACRPSMAFVVVAPHTAGASGVCAVSGVPAAAGTAGFARESTSTSPRSRRRIRRSRSSRRSVSRVVGSSSSSSSSSSRSRSTSENNVSLADGLTTSSTETQNGGREAQESGLHLDSGIFVPTPGSASLEAALTRSPHFRDIIMGGVEGDRREQQSGLLHDFEPMERVVLTANGNLQRMLSSYYNSPVTVDIKYCTEMEPSVYEREVEISIFGSVFCRAKSLVVLHNPACVKAVKTGSVGIGQLFRSLDILPNFELLNAGHWTGSTSAFEGNSNDCGDEGGAQGRGGGKGGLWRVYDLRSRHLSCRIHEEFLPDLFDIKSDDNSN